MKLQPQKGSYEDFLNGNTANKIFHFKLVRANAASSMTDSYGRPITYVGSHRIEAFAVIAETDKNGRPSQRTIRVIEGEQSIYKDEQSNDKDIPKKKVYINFIDGIKLVSGEEVSLLRYMMLDNLNLSNKNRNTRYQPIYELVDNAKIIEKEMLNEEIMDEAKHFAFKGDWDEVKAYARVLNVDLNRDAKEIRWDLRNIAQRDPVKFMENLKSPTMRKKHNVLEAIDAGYLTINPLNNSIAWATNPNQPLDVAAVGKGIVDSFVRKLTTDDGKLIYDAIVDMVQPASDYIPKMTIPTREELEALKATVAPVPSLKIAEESDEELLEMLEKAHAAGIVTFTKPMWFYYKKDSFQKKQGFIDALKSNPVMLDSLKRDLAKL